MNFEDKEKNEKSKFKQFDISEAEVGFLMTIKENYGPTGNQSWASIDEINQTFVDKLNIIH